MKHLIAILMALMPMLASAASIDDLRARDPDACPDITIENNYPGLLDCAGRIADRSQKKLQDRLVEIRKELVRINSRKFTTAFEAAQAAWETYESKYCAYKTAQIDKRGSAYGFILDICHALENYRRIDTLKDEPATS